MKMTTPLPAPAFDSPAHHLRLYQGDCLEILAKESSEREAFLGATVPDSRRDILARVTHKGHK